ncbi:hypothetical protein CHS0354_021516 [Potamilus streckersoni]|uniref:Uncharacterized protein n=1 Tax=Potamilus streckersoni TaxID=2493646 RepID=A0AAE0VZY2_9BIVA|nr:hypothetical protein CHS0354_021516 [Potamilus streckersoni]
METCVKEMLWIFALGIFRQAFVPATNAAPCLSSSKWKFNLSCNDDGKIFDVNVTSATGECEQSSCNGYTPQLIMQKLNCYWKNNCSIDLRKDIIIQSVDDQRKCIGTKPDVLLLHSWKCTKKGVKIYDFTEKTDFKILFDRGILRSHARFPWDYFFSDFCTNYKSFTCSRTVTFWLKPKYTFVITVHKVNVTEPDSLTWYTKQDTTPRPVSMGTMTFDDSAEAISLQLNLAEDSKGDSGFLICYQYSANGASIIDACHDLTTTHDDPKILRSKREKDTQKHKGSKKKRINKTERNDRRKKEKKTKGNKLVN